MLYYLIPYVFLVFSSVLFYHVRLSDTNRRFLFFLMVLPAILIAVFRGNVGTDTINYLSNFYELNMGEVIHLEPGFELLASAINLLGFNARFGVACVSALTALLLTKSFSESKEQIALFSLLLFPVFFYDMTMNGLRYGLSFSISSIAVSYLYKKNNIAAVLIGIVAISIQYSSLLILFVFFSVKLNRVYLLVLLLAIVLFVLFFPSMLTYFYEKQDFYKDLVAPEATSGLGPLLLFLVIFASIYFYAGDKRSKDILWLILLLEIISFIIAKISYAGLRLQTLFLFSLILQIKQEYHTIIKKNEYLMLLIFIGAIGFMFTAKNLAYSNDDILSPFIPYKFFWQENY